ncbi:hypothetical protein DV451_005068 [Geotrichum candidum]|uniref:Pre-mRNA-splicing factor RSE1 n=1 Tax=Geotrichum candidum TaxID=1173061 RepID=A0A9P5KS03_GEOCN|nr:hypothetical protein DV451_005068 [Geotrichum candidum]KAF5106428.1 hypothetical protein DV453_003919 [Geotrichum candidum]
MSLDLYSLTLSKPGSVVRSITGQFTGRNSTQDLLIARGSYLQLLRPDKITRRLVPLLSYNVFGIIRSLAVFRIAGSSQDHIIVTSDSGRIVILDYDESANKFVQLHMETFGKAGITRTSPGQYLAVDPKGRAAMIASVEKNKLVYVLNRDAAANVTISSPLEANTSRTLVYDVVGVDMGYENPVFAALEVDYGSIENQNGDIPKKKLTFYELDLGLNHVVRRWSEHVDRHASLLLQVPGADGDNLAPSGVLVATKNYISYYNMNQPELRVPIPKREGSNQDTTIVAGVMHKIKGAFFFLVQNELGDIFKITLTHDKQEPIELKIKYFDTIPRAVSFNIFKSGFLFAACEFGNHQFYQFIKLGDDDDGQPEYSSSYYVKGDMDQYEPAYFTLHELDNLMLVDELSSLSPLLTSQVANLDPTKETPQIYAVSGQSSRSTFRSIHYGLAVNEIVSAELPAVPLAVWTTKVKEDDEFDKYIVLSFSNETLVMSIGESIEEITDSGFQSSVSTIAVQQLGRDSLLQIHRGGLRHILSSGTVNEWEPPEGKYITHASTNNYQVIIALTSSEANYSMIYFELDEEGQLNEYSEQELPSRPASLCIGDVPAGRLRSPFLVVGSDEDQTVRMYSLELERVLEGLFTRSLSAPPSDMRILYLTDNSFDKDSKTLFLHIGMNNGVYMKAKMDSVTGELSQIRTRFLGPGPIKLFPIVAQNQSCIMALCTSTWLGFVQQGTEFTMAPLEYSRLSYAAGFASEEYTEGIVGIQDNNIKRMARNSFSNHFYIVEADANTVPAADEEEEQTAKQFGYVKSKGAWASAVEAVDPLTLEVTSSVQLTNNDSGRLVVNCFFESHDKEYLVVGGGSTKGGALYVFEYSEDGSRISLLHKTPVAEHPTCMIEFQGRLLVALGAKLVFYELGTKQLLRKGEHRFSPTLFSTIITLDTQGSRLIAGDIKESLVYLVYKPAIREFIPFADDVLKRHVTASMMLDYDTTIAGDRFGNIFVLRCPKTVSNTADEDDFGTYIATASAGASGGTGAAAAALGGAPNKLELLAHFHVEDVPTAFSKATLAIGGRDAVVWTGIQGTIGALVPMATSRDRELLEALEKQLRVEHPPLAGNHHLMYRGYYAPPKAIVDGDLCAQYASLPADKQAAIAEALEKSIDEILRKLEDIRITSVF